MEDYTKSTESACAQTENMEVSFSIQMYSNSGSGDILFI